MANLKKNDFAQTLYFGRVISPKNCYAIGLLIYCATIEKCASFDDATETAILTLNFNQTSAGSHRQTMHSIAIKTQTVARVTFTLLCQFDKGYLITSFQNNFFL